MSDYNNAVDLKNDNALFQRAKLENKLGKYQSAVDDYSRLLEPKFIPPSYRAAFLHGRALAEKHLNRAAQASEDFAEEKKLLEPREGCILRIKPKLEKP
jgi:tetratricopeptide (TPR) repeat protein